MIIKVITLTVKFFISHWILAAKLLQQRPIYLCCSFFPRNVEEYAKLMPPLFWENYRKNIVKSLDEKGPAQHIVAEYGGKIVGSVLLYPPDASAYGDATGEGAVIPEMRLLAVDPVMRGHGIGNALTRECVVRAQRAGAPALGLHTADIMQTAMHMYERMGFIRAPELDFHPSADAVIKGYRLPLGQDLVI